MIRNRQFLPVFFRGQDRNLIRKNQVVGSRNIQIVILICAAVCAFYLLCAGAIHLHRSLPDIVPFLSGIEFDPAALAEMLDDFVCDARGSASGRGVITCESSMTEQSITHIDMVTLSGNVLRLSITFKSNSITAGDLAPLIQGAFLKEIRKIRFQLGGFNVIVWLDYWSGASYFHQWIRQIEFSQ